MKYPPFVFAIALVAMSSSYALAQSTGSGISVLPPGASTTTSHQEKAKPGTTGMGSGATKSTNTGEPNGTVGGPTSHSAEQARPNTADPRQEGLTVSKVRQSPAFSRGFFGKVKFLRDSSFDWSNVARLSSEPFSSRRSQYEARCHRTP